MLKKHGLNEISSEELDQKLFSAFHTFNTLCSSKGTEVRFYVSYLPVIRSAPTGRVGIQRALNKGLLASKNKGWRILVPENEADNWLKASHLTEKEWLSVVKPFL